MVTPFSSSSLRIRSYPFCLLHNEPCALWISLHRLLNRDLDLIFLFLCPFLLSNGLPRHCHCELKVLWGRLLPQFTGTSQRANSLEELSWNDVSPDTQLGEWCSFKAFHSKQQGQGPLIEVFNDQFLTSECEDLCFTLKLKILSCWDLYTGWFSLSGSFQLWSDLSLSTFHITSRTTLRLKKTKTKTNSSSEWSILGSQFQKCPLVGNIHILMAITAHWNNNNNLALC